VGLSAGDVFLDVHPNLSSFNKELAGRLGGLRGAAEGILRPFGVSIGTAVTAGAGIAIAKFVGSSVQAFSHAEQIAAQTAAVIESTGGAANVSAEQVDEYAVALADLVGADDEATQASLNLLLTFRQIRDEEGPANTFERTATAVLDMATAMNSGAIPSLEELRSTTIQVGKAVNDPIKGLTALQRVGVTFTQAQRDQIDAMLKANDLMGAQDVILSELEAEFGGAAEAAGETFAGSVGDLSREFGDLMETVGEAVVPILEGLVDVLQVLVPILKLAAENLELVGIAMGTILLAKAAPVVLFEIARAAEIIGATKAAGVLLNISAGAAGLAAAAAGPVALGAAAVGLGAAYDVANKGASDFAHELGGLEVATAVGGETTLRTADGQKILTLSWNEAEDTLRGLVASGDRWAAQAAAYQGAQHEIAGSVEKTNEQLAKQAQRHLEAAAAALEQRSAELSLAGGIVGIAEDFRSLQEAQAELDRLRERGVTSGRRYEEAQRGVLDAGLALTGSLQEQAAEMLAQGETTDTVRDKLLDLAEQYGLNRNEIRELLPSIDRLITKYGDVPEKVETRITLDGIDLALAQVASLDNRLQEITEKEWKANLNLQTTGGSTAFDLLDELKAELVAIGEEDWDATLELKLAGGSIRELERQIDREFGRIRQTADELTSLLESAVEEGLPRAHLEAARELADVISDRQRHFDKLLSAAERHFDKLRERVEEFQDSIRSGFADTGDLIGTLIDAQAEALREGSTFGEAEIRAVLQDQVAQAQQLAGGLTQLQALGLGPAGLAELAQQGPDALPLIQALLAGGPDLIASFEQSAAAIAAFAGETESSLAEVAFGDALEQAAGDVDRLRERLEEVIDRLGGRVDRLVEAVRSEAVAREIDGLLEGLRRLGRAVGADTGGGDVTAGPNGQASANGSPVVVNVYGDVTGQEIVERVRRGLLTISRDNGGWE
jgi:hypothetical protein